ncbi:MAG TPA: type II DNA modification enzyme, partial [Acidobacteriota bacterium]|nr:type II DNA modification enzyme [Acidobacteriota bacterium]
MQTNSKSLFLSLRTEGALLPADVLHRISEADSGLGGLTPAEYHLIGNEKLNEAINRSWNRLQGAWSVFKTARERLNPADAATSVTRERWLLPLFQELGYGRLMSVKAFTIEDKPYAISHLWQDTPIHLVGVGIEIDRRTAGATGAARQSPHSLVQEFLNRSEAHLWAFVSNGLRLRVLRDNKSLTRQAFIEFDLEAMFEGQLYSDFVVLWLVCHQSRVEAERPEHCWLEKWSQTARTQGTRVLDQLRDGIQQAISALGSGFLAHPANTALREKLRSGMLSPQDYYRQLLRTVYRLLFLCVAEDRDLLHDPNGDLTAKERYFKYYSVRRLRQMAGSIRGTQHTDLWHGISTVFGKLDSDGCEQLALPALNSFLWASSSIPDLPPTLQITNRAVLDALRVMVFTVEKNTRRPVDFKNLGAEELGSVYESLLELIPEINTDT